MLQTLHPPPVKLEIHDSGVKYSSRYLHKLLKGQDVQQPQDIHSMAPQVCQLRCLAAAASTTSLSVTYIHA